MKNNKTFTIIKPDAFEKGYAGAILEKITKNGFKIIALKIIQMHKKDAEGFYAIHKNKSFFADLVKYMTRSPVVVAALEKENAVADFRKLIGATNPLEAAEGTIRKLYANSLQENAIHGSDSDENAAIEINFHFSQTEIFD